MNFRGRYSSIVTALLLTWGVGGDRLVSAATFYVAPGGNDGNLGTAAQPWATLQHAADVVLPGAVVIVRPGTYAGAKFSHSGTSQAPMLFHGQPGAVINAPGPSNTICEPCRRYLGMG